MKSRTSEFKEEIKTLGKQQSVRITYKENNVTKTLTNEDINSATPNYEASLLKSVMKGLDLDSNINIPIGTEIKFEYGLLVNGAYEYLNYGTYIVKESEKQEDTLSYKITCYDKLLYSMKDYEHIEVNYPCKIKKFLIELCKKIGLEFKDSTFANQDREFASELFMTINEDGTYSSMGYTYRDVLDQIAETTGGCICMTLDDKVEVRYINKALEYSTSKNTNEVEIGTQVKEKVKTINIDGNSYQGENPSPDNPQEIKNVGENGIKIKQSGKNLLNTMSYTTETKNGVTATRQNDGSIKVTGTATADTQFDIALFTPSSKEKTYFLSGCPKGGSISTYYLNLNVYGKNDVGNGFSFTNVINSTYVRIKVLNGVSIDTIFMPMIVEGIYSEATPYEPYHEPKITPINLQGNILSKIGNVKDILKINRNGEVEIKKNIEKVVLDGTENWVTLTAQKGDNTSYFYYAKTDMKKASSIICNQFINRAVWSTDVEGIQSIIDNLIRLRINTSRASTVSELKAWLVAQKEAGTPVIVYYELATPQIITLPSISPIELWQGTNIFSLVTNLDTEIELEYPTNYDTIDEEYINDTNVNFGEKYRTY